MPLGDEHSLSSEELLAAGEQELVELLRKCYDQSSKFAVPRITGLSALTVDQRAAIRIKLKNASEKMDPLKAAEINETLQSAFDTQSHQIESDDEWCPSTASPSPERIPTEQKAERLRQQLRYHAKLVQDGGKPILEARLLGSALAMSKENLRKVSLWVDLPKSGELGSDMVLPVFSAQLNHWNSFRHFWQWSNRGDASLNVGKALYIELVKAECLETGKGRVTGPWLASCEGAARRRWQFEQTKYTASRSRTGTFESYVDSVEKRLVSRGFTREFHLLVDPRKQDAWTTWVEYLSYIYREMELYESEMKAAELNFWITMSGLADSYWDEVVRLDRLVKERFFKIRNAVIQQLTKWRKVRRGRRRARWVLKELDLIEKCGGGSDYGGPVRGKEEERTAGQPPSLRTTGAENDERQGNGRSGAKISAVPPAATNSSVAGVTGKRKRNIDDDGGGREQDDDGRADAGDAQDGEAVAKRPCTRSNVPDFRHQ